MESISVKVTKIIEIDRSRLFDYFIPLELPKVLRGYGLLPAVIKVSNQTGAWDIPGHARTVHLSDGSTAYEEVTSCDRPELFSYKVSKFTGIFGFLVSGANGIWKFNCINNELTEMMWEYSFYAKGLLAHIVLKPIIKLIFQRYMEQVIEDFFILAKQNIDC